MTARVECVAEVRFPISVVRLIGMLDESGATAVGEFLLGCLTEHPVAVVIDLSGLSVVDDLALTLLPTVARRAAEWPGADMMLCAPDHDLAGALDRTGVSRQVRVCHDRNAALAAAADRPAPRRLRQSLPASVDAPRQARELIARAAMNWRLPTDSMQVAQVIATELVTNAVRHARPPMDFSVVLREGFLQLAVSDGDPSPPERPLIMTEHDDHGRGLQLVDALGVGWGSLPIPAGKVVWASVRTG